jgi:hypothetical protein
MGDLFIDSEYTIRRHPVMDERLVNTFPGPFFFETVGWKTTKPFHHSATLDISMESLAHILYCEVFRFNDRSDK